MIILLCHTMIFMLAYSSIRSSYGNCRYLAASVWVWAFIILLYVVPFWVMPLKAENYFLERGYIKLLLLAMFCGLGFQLGFKFSMTKENKSKSLIVYDDYNIIFFSGLSVMISLGIYLAMILNIGVFVFYGKTHNYGALSHVSGYVYQMRDVSFGGLAILSFYLWKRMLSRIWLSVFYMGMCVIIFDAILMGVRGTFIRILVFGLILISIKVWPELSLISRKKVLKRAVIFGSFSVFLILAMPMLRTVTHFGDLSESDLRRNSAVEDISTVDLIKKSLFGSDTGRGNEMLIASTLVQARDEMGVLDAGYKWLLPVFNFIPRSLWHDKPLWGDFSINIASVMLEAGYWVPIFGSAETGIADSYMRFAWLAPFFWLLLGMFGGTIYRKSFNEQDEYSWVIYSAFLVGMIYFLTQNFFPLFYSLFYIVVPVGFIKIASMLRSGKVYRYFL